MAYNPGSEFIVSSDYGLRTDSNGNSQFHPGIDFKAPIGTDVRAATSGTVWYSGNNSLYGNCVIVQHDAGDGTSYYTLYAHMNGAAMPALNQDISAGEKIGEVGNTGLSDGPHLHYEVLWPPEGVEPRHANGGPIGIEPYWYRRDPKWPFPGTLGAPEPTWWDKIKSTVGDFFLAAQRTLFRGDPLTLDLDGDGIETVGINPTTPILFDTDGDGVKTATGWIGSDDGLLVLDRNGNGMIDSGRELFGDSTLLNNGQEAADGFAALADQDTNSDGKVDSADTHFANLRIWRDLNQDGISQGNELTTLSANNIASINVTATEHTQTLANGNQIADLGTYTKTDGTNATAGMVSNLADVNLAEDTFIRHFEPLPVISPEAQALPNMQGSGLVRKNNHYSPPRREGRKEQQMCINDFKLAA